MTTQADITLALFHVTNTSGPALLTDIDTLINAIADQSDLTSVTTHLIPPLLAQINAARATVVAMIAAISATAGASAV